MERVEARVYRLATPLGVWAATFTDAGLRELRLPETLSQEGRQPRQGKGPIGNGAGPWLEDREGEAGRRLTKLLSARLAGSRVDMPWEAFDLSGRPPFFVRAWQALHRIPFGEVRTYGQIARVTGSPNAVRAVGQACGANPIVLFIPCHRVVAASGPGGFGAGLEWKRRLLELEGHNLDSPGRCWPALTAWQRRACGCPLA